MSELLFVKWLYKWRVKDFYTFDQFKSLVLEWKTVPQTRPQLKSKRLAIRRKNNK